MRLCSRNKKWLTERKKEEVKKYYVGCQLNKTNDILMYYCFIVKYAVKYTIVINQ